MRNFVRAVVGTAALLVVACGGGGDGGGPPVEWRSGFAELQPSTILSMIPKWLTAISRTSGDTFGQQGDSAVLRFVAVSGTPFQGGTSDTVDLPAQVGNAHIAYATTPHGFCAEECRAWVIFVRSDGVEYLLREPVLLLPGTRLAPVNPEQYGYFGQDVAVEGVAMLTAAGRGSDSGNFFEIQPKNREAPHFDIHGACHCEFQEFSCGWAADLTGEWAFVGAPGHEVVQERPKGGYVTYENGGALKAGPINWSDTEPDPPSWHPTEYLTASDAHADARLGAAVDATDSRVIVGAPGWRFDLSYDAGAAYVFALPASGETPVEEARLLPFQSADPTQYDGSTGDEFGAAVAIHGTAAAVAAPNADGEDQRTGAVYTYVNHYGTWEPEQKLTAPHGDRDEVFGLSVALEGDTLVVGSPGTLNDYATPGTAYVYRRSAGVWTLHQELRPRDSSGGQLFGHGVAIRLDRIVIGAPYDHNRGERAGAAYVYERGTDSQWYEAVKLVSPEVVYDSQFGYSVDLDPSRVLIGAPTDWWGGRTYVGAIYLY